MTLKENPMHVLVLQGPNLNRLGKRDPRFYGTHPLTEVTSRIDTRAGELDVKVDHVQANCEGRLIDWLQERQDGADAIICNPAGLTNYGLSLRDALSDTGLDLAIVHLSNPLGREPWRREDVFAEIADLYLAGAGWHGYVMALDGLHARAADRT
ncbi:type II 3-dehydroquinate dehydratase [Amycolatopsis sp. NPDC023774]|uniref:type II 3-dehydroquinate dehydratase n=1 Tax=Amycolatopsis sp. NPDC023774 TaxID=3155015 RepID=UPI0033C54AE3